MVVNTLTDNFLCAYSCVKIYRSLCDYLKKFFDITTEEGTSFMYLNFRIIQSEFGVSFDQTEHILGTIVKKFFPSESCKRLKQVLTPVRTDNEFKADLSEMAGRPNSLRFTEIFGQLLHVQVFTRSDLGYTCSCLSCYTQSPSAAYLAALHHGLRFLASHPHCPIICLRRSIDGYDTLHVNFDPPKQEAIQLPNGLIILVDSDHACGRHTR